MSMQIIALIFVVLSFTVLVVWTFWPSNKERFESEGRLVLDDEELAPATAEGEKS